MRRGFGRRLAIFGLLGALLCGQGSAAFSQPAIGRASSGPGSSAAGRPNIVLILVDDAALMDFGAFGGEAHTPNIDRLARSGAMLTGYHTSPLCSPSRAMLLTGVDNHRAGVATIEEILPPSQKGKRGYDLQIEPGVLTIADRLKAGGYRTLMAGKWHLGHGPGALPNSHGFDRSLALDASGADNWAPKPYMPYYTEAPWFEDGKPARLPKRFYSSDLLVDRLRGYIDERPPGAQPFFAYLAFQAVHIPVQAPKAVSDRYAGRFDGGWPALRAARNARAKALGLIPQNAPTTGMPEDSRRWEALTPKERAIYARSMEVYAGMLESMDASIGRLVQHLEDRGELDETLFVITSDNGPEFSDPVHATGMNIWMPLHGYAWRLNGLGEPGSLNFIGRDWAAALSAPSRLFKFYTTEGGLRVPLILSGPGVRPGSRIDAQAFVTDVTPTLIDLAGVPAGPAGAALDGRSLKPVLTGAAQTVRAEHEAVGIEVSGNAALFRGRWKITRVMPPAGDGRWRLYDLSADPGETRDMSGEQAELMADMLREYAAYEARVGVARLPVGYNTQRQLMANSLQRQKGGIALIVGVVTVLALAGVGFLFWRRRRAGR